MRFCTSLIILLCSLLLLRCSNAPEEIGVVQVEESRAISSAPSESEVTIGPIDARAQSMITLSADNSLLHGAEVHWYVNDVMDDSTVGKQFSSPDLTKGDVIKAIVVKEEKEYESNEITIINTPPAISRAVLSPSFPKTDTAALSIEINVQDDDNDVINLRYKWTHNGRFAGETDYLETELKRDDDLSVEVTPYDEDGSGNTITLTSKVYNSLPVFEESVPSFNGNVYEYEVTAYDSDNDDLVFSLEEAPEGMNIDSTTGKITWTVGTDNTGYHEFTVRISDGHGGELLIPITTTLDLAENTDQESK
jgi:hypothetical protein